MVFWVGAPRTYGGGSFVARWLTRAGERGAVSGEYRETVPGRHVGGHYLARSAERSCNLDIAGE